MRGEKIDILTGEYVTLSFQKADAGQRLGATFIDWIILSILIVIIEKTFDSEIVYSLIPFVNLLIEYKTKGYTIGKKILGLRVISDDCTPPSFLQCFMRWLLFTIDFWLIGLILISKKGQRLGDMASGCQCISTRNSFQDDVNLGEEFEYLTPNYKVKYHNANQLEEKDITIITKVLYYNGYKHRTDEIAKQVETKLKIARRSSAATFLKDILNDYKYLNMATPQDQAE